MHLFRTFLLLTAACAVWPGCANVSPRSFTFSPPAKTKTDAESLAKDRSNAERQDSEVEREASLASTPPATSTHDSATQLLIATELRDAPSEDRLAWMAYINTLPAAEVPKALRERRLGATPGIPRTVELEQQAALLAESRGKELSSPQQASMPSGESSAILPASASSVDAAPPIVTPQHSLASSPRQADPQPPQQSTSEPEPEHNSLFPTWSDWDKSKFWHPPEATQRLRDKLPLPKIIAGGERNNEVVEQPIVQQPAAVSPQLSAELLDRPIPQPDLRISPGASLWEDEVRKLIALLEADASMMGTEGSTQKKQYVRQQVALRMLYLIAEDPQKAQRVIPQLPPSDQEFWTNVFQGLSTYLNDSDIDPMDRKTQAISQLRTAVHHLQASARLQVRNLNFCHRIDGFGNYERFPQDVFAPGDAVLLYCELRNFHSEPTADGYYESRMRSSIQFVRQGDDLVADQTEFETTRDLSRTMRTDYYHAHRLDLPQLSPGAYILKLRVEDELSGKIATESIPLTIR